MEGYHFQRCRTLSLARVTGSSVASFLSLSTMLRVSAAPVRCAFSVRCDFCSQKSPHTLFIVRSSANSPSSHGYLSEASSLQPAFRLSGFEFELEHGGT